MVYSTRLKICNAHLTLSSRIIIHQDSFMEEHINLLPTSLIHFHNPSLTEGSGNLNPNHLATLEPKILSRLWSQTSRPTTLPTIRQANLQPQAGHQAPPHQHKGYIVPSRPSLIHPPPILFKRSTPIPLKARLFKDLLLILHLLLLIVLKTLSLSSLNVRLGLNLVPWLLLNMDSHRSNSIIL